MKTLHALFTLAALGFAALQVDASTAVNATAEASAITCANVRCQSGTQCVLQQVQCIRAPCPAMPKCIPVESPTPSTNACTPGFCDDSETCELKQVQCITAPCPPMLTCVPQKVTTHECNKKCSRFQRCYLYNSQPHCADVCSPTRCAKNERCELQSVQCFVAPCPRVAMCLSA